MPFLDGTVADAITLRYAFCPLTFHYGAWIMTKIIPYMEDLCYADSKQCGRYLEYIGLAFDQQDWVITATNTSYNELIVKWTQVVAENMTLDVTELRKLYDYASDMHNSEMRTRYMWKYTAARSVGGTPSAFVNGVKLQNIPANADQWKQLV